jgi:hypothetical protein
MAYRQLWGPWQYLRAQKNKCISRGHDRVAPDVCPLCWASLAAAHDIASLEQMHQYVKLGTASLDRERR